MGQSQIVTIAQVFSFKWRFLAVAVVIAKAPYCKVVPQLRLDRQFLVDQLLQTALNLAKMAEKDGKPTMLFSLV